MRIRIRSAVLVCLLATAFSAQPLDADDQPARPTPAHPSRPAPPRQQPPPLVFIAVNGGYQSNTLTFTDTGSRPLNGESLTWTADYAVKSGPLFDVEGGVRVWSRLFAAVGYTRFAETRDVAVSAQVPHPFFFNQSRAIEGDAAGAKHVEQAVHVSALWIATVTPHIQVGVFGGPSFFFVNRDLVEDVIQAEQGYPYDTASFDHADIARVNKSAVGFHAGADVTWRLTKSVGVGAVVRFARATVDLPSPATQNPIALDVGGVQVGGGIRFSFGSRSSRPTHPPVRRP
jgi:hypothetical protein